MGKRGQRGRGNPKKDPSARRRRAGRRVAPAPEEIPEEVRAEVLMEGVQGVSPGAAPIMLCAGVWMLHGVWAGHPGNNCIDGCMTLRFALEHLGITSDVRLLRVMVASDDGTATAHGADRPQWKPDGTFDGHAVLVVHEGPFLVDATLPQFPEVPADSLQGQVLPVVVRLPSDVVFDGRDAITVPRQGHTVSYLPARTDPDLLAHPIIRQTEPQYRHAATNLATKTIALLNSDYLADAFPTLPYPSSNASATSSPTRSSSRTPPVTSSSSAAQPAPRYD